MRLREIEREREREIERDKERENGRGHTSNFEVDQITRRNK